MQKLPLFWFRRDLRLDDNHGLYQALHKETCVQPVFIFDKNILDQLENPADRRVTFIYQALEEIKTQLNKWGADLWVFHGKPVDIFSRLLSEYSINTVYCNHDYEPYGTSRDDAVKKLLRQKQADFFSFKDQVVLEKSEVVKDNGDAYSVFTPYYRKYLKTLQPHHLQQYSITGLQKNLHQQKAGNMFALATMGFEENSSHLPERSIPRKIIATYDQTRDFPAAKGTSRLGIHLRFGTLGIRQLMKLALATNDTFAKELIWREFYQMILFHFPHTVDKAFKPAYDNIPWQNDSKLFQRWSDGTTGYPLVDAGMRELNETGYMHNRVRMVVASFLCKHLLIDWRWGERYFAARLNDFDLASNVGGWQWAAGSGCDAAPYFRIFNPEAQQKKFDPDKKYIAKWISDYNNGAYASPVIEHKFARERALATYKEGLAAG